jgi:hypothetical protein
MVCSLNVIRIIPLAKDGGKTKFIAETFYKKVIRKTVK